jgi:hypothetical protein
MQQCEKLQMDLGMAALDSYLLLRECSNVKNFKTPILGRLPLVDSYCDDKVPNRCQRLSVAMVTYETVQYLLPW